VNQTKYSKELLESLVNQSDSVSDILRKMNLKPAGGSHRLISSLIKYYGIDISKFKKIAKARIADCSLQRKRTKEQFTRDILCKDSKVLCSTYSIKKRILEYGLKQNCCDICKQQPEWNNLPLVLQLDHINGDRKDNRLESIRLLCPNCHSQTKNFSGKSKGRNSVV